MKILLIACIIALAFTQFLEPRLRGPVGPAFPRAPFAPVEVQTGVQWNARPNEKPQPAFIAAPSPADTRISPPVAAWDANKKWGYIEPANRGGWNGY